LPTLRVFLPNLHSNQATRPGVVQQSDVQQIVLAIYQRCGASSAVIMGKSWGGGMAVEFVATHASIVNALVLVAPALSDLTLLGRLITVPTTLFWARDDTVKEFALSSHYTSAVPGLELHPAEEGGHRVLPEYLPFLRAALARTTPGLGKA
jgi:pimeloyl-ACP methyl ester carboxylesterase